MDEDYGLIRRIEVTTAKVLDSQVDLAKVGEVRYADKGYFGAKTKAYDAAMRKATRGHPLSYSDEMRNKRISSKRSPVERFRFNKEGLQSRTCCCYYYRQGSSKEGKYRHCLQSLSFGICKKQNSGIALADKEI
jgi:IS5 family transposase